MALIKCPYCGGTVSDKAARCPHCSRQFTGAGNLQNAPAANAAAATPPAAAPASAETQIDNMYAPPRSAPIFAPTPAPGSKHSSQGRVLLYVVLALLFGAACGAGFYIFNDRKHKSSDSGKPSLAAAARTENVAEQHRAWDDDEAGCEYDDDDLGCIIHDPVPDGAEHLYGNVYAISTDELDECGDWVKPLLPDNARRAAVFADRIWLRSSMSTSDSSNKLALLEYGTHLDVVSQPNDKWTEVRISGGEHHGLRGYAATEFIISVEQFSIMDSHITPDADSREKLSTAKWRRALTDAVCQYGWAGVTDGLIVSTPYKLEALPREVIAFRLFDPSDYTAFMAFIEFYDGDEEYRLLGCTDDCDVRHISVISTGTYRLELDFSSMLQ
ncbi:MAG: hypothetical protein K2J31_02675 [Alistipes sp.]|nr:hypothetical protein [Alistipes sp.]